MKKYFALFGCGVFTVLLALVSQLSFADSANLEVFDRSLFVDYLLNDTVSLDAAVESTTNNVKITDYGKPVTLPLSAEIRVDTAYDLYRSYKVPWRSRH